MNVRERERDGALLPLLPPEPGRSLPGAPQDPPRSTSNLKLEVLR